MRIMISYAKAISKNRIYIRANISKKTSSLRKYFKCKIRWWSIVSGAVWPFTAPLLTKSGIYLVTLAAKLF